MSNAFAGPSPSEHPVQAARRRIAEAFAADRAGPLPTNAGGPVAGLILPLLECIGWRGQPREVAEAMPHETPVGDVELLRAVLARLGVETPLADIKPAKLRNEHCPCLIIRGATEVVLVAAIDDKGEARVFDAAAGGWERRKPSGLRGVIRRVMPVDPGERQEALQRDGFVWPVLRSFRGNVVGIVWQSLLISLIGLAVSIYVMLVYDKAIGTGSVDTLAMLALGALGLLGIEMMLRHRRARTLARIAARFDALVATGSLKCVLGLPLSLSEGAPLGAQLMRFRQFEVGREIFGGNLVTALLDLPFTLIFFALIFALGGTLGFVPVAFAVILAIIGLLTDPLSGRRMREMGQWKGRSDGVLVEIVTRMRTIRDDNAEEIWMDRASESYKHFLDGRFRTLQLAGVLQIVAQALGSIAGVAVLGLGAMEVMTGALSMGALIAIMAVVWRVLAPVQTVFLSLHRIRSTAQTLRQIEQLIKMRQERPAGRPAGGDLRLAGAVTIASAFLRYGARQDLALKGLSLAVRPGEFVAITGPSGSGKSSLLKAVLGLYPLQSGAIRLDDLDLRQLDPAQARQSIGFLPQEPAVFFGTVAQNLRLQAPDATDDELAAALAALGIRLDHPALPDGLETRLNATNRQAMSLAFVQRLALARLFVRQWPILLFDEPSSHLDREGDEALMAALARLKGRATILMVTARPSHMRGADRVVVLQDGQVAAQGKPDEIVPALLAQATRPAA